MLIRSLSPYPRDAVREAVGELRDAEARASKDDGDEIDAGQHGFLRRTAVRAACPRAPFKITRDC